MCAMRACIPGMVLVVAAVVGGTPAFARAGDLVAISNNDVGLNDAPAGTGTVVRMDPTTGEVAAARVVDRSGVAMAWSHVDQAMYAVQHYELGAQLLVEIDATTLEVVDDVGVLTDASDDTVTHKVTALGVASDGELYGISAKRTFIGGVPVPVGRLVSIDLDTAETSVVGSLGMPVFSRGGAIVDDEFVLVSQRSRSDREMLAWRVDLADASVASIGSTGMVGDAVGLAVDGFRIDESVDTRGGDAVDRVDILILESSSFPEGFTLTGTMTFSWSGDAKKPGAAHSMVQIAWGNIDD